ncbi:hypothetical protein C4R89_12415 [Clostridioides difficile]|nr:hypothetical protein [Clostridioides difficile]MDB0440336.1 hypothetical protein [Clostridioides difficile]
MDIRKELKEFFGERPLFYIKFTREEKWAKDILEGKLFMNKVDYYRQLEVNSGIKGQGDLSELKAKIIPLEIKIESKDTNLVIPLKVKSLEFELDEDKQKPVFCITGLTIDDMIIDSYCENSVKLRFPYKKEEADLLRKEFGEYVVVLNPKQFEENISNTLNNEGIGWIFGKVKYTGENSFERIKAFSNSTPERFLYKDLEFQHQKEYRLVLDENIENNKTLSIGSLCNAGGIQRIDDFLTLEIVLNFR